MNEATLLDPQDPPAYRVERAQGSSPFVLTCDHAGCALPARLGNLGITQAELETHIGWDLGVAELGRLLSAELDAFLISQTYSRLVIDANRPPGSAQSIVARSEWTDVPGNRELGPAEAEARAQAVFWPYHTRIREEIDRRLQAGRATALITLHSFTPVFMGVARAIEVGVLYGRDVRFGHALLSALGSEPGLVVGDNEPYAVSDDTDYTLITHGEQRGIPHVELEIRQDLLASEAGRRVWANRLARLLAPIASRLFPA